MIGDDTYSIYMGNYSVNLESDINLLIIIAVLACQGVSRQVHKSEHCAVVEWAKKNNF